LRGVTQREKTVAAILSGNSDANIAFDDLRGLLVSLGFVERTKGSHHTFRRPDVRERINLQVDKGKAKPYQVKQVREILLKYRLGGQR
jgi:predicted RNA binding protein YcfA (HicA-like mRNA interferase family)